MHVLSEKLARKSEPNGVFPEPSRHRQPFGRTVIVFGTEMALGAVLDHDVSQADSKEEAGYPRGGSPIVFDAVRSIISVGLKVHIPLSKSALSKKRRWKSVLQDRTKYYIDIRSSNIGQLRYLLTDVATIRTE